MAELPIPGQTIAAKIGDGFLGYVGAVDVELDEPYPYVQVGYPEPPPANLPPQVTLEGDHPGEVILAAQVNNAQHFFRSVLIDVDGAGVLTLRNGSDDTEVRQFTFTEAGFLDLVSDLPLFVGLIGSSVEATWVPVDDADRCRISVVTKPPEAVLTVQVGAEVADLLPEILGGFPVSLDEVLILRPGDLVTVRVVDTSEPTKVAFVCGGSQIGGTVVVSGLNATFGGL